MTGDVPGHNVDFKDLQEKKKKCEELEWKSMPFENAKYTSRMKYECAIVMETEKLMRATYIYVSTILADVVTNLKNTRIQKPSILPRSL